MTNRACFEVGFREGISALIQWHIDTSLILGQSSNPFQGGGRWRKVQAAFISVNCHDEPNRL